MVFTQQVTISSLRVDSISCRSFCLSLILSPAPCLFPRFKRGENASFAASLRALRDAKLQLLSSNSARVTSNSPSKTNRIEYNSVTHTT